MKCTVGYQNWAENLTKLEYFLKNIKKKPNNFEEIFFYEILIKQVNLNYDYQKI